MSAVMRPLPAPQDGSLLDKLLVSVRAEFQGELIRIDPDDPVFARGRCSVEGCDRGAWSRLLCAAHYNRWRLGGRPEMPAFCATTGPIVPRGDPSRVDAFDLRGLDLQPRLEIAYSIQCRHDDRSVRLIPEMIRQFVNLLATAKAGSLLDRPVDDWVQMTIATGTVGSGSRTVGQLRYAYRKLTDLVGGADADSEFARDTWRAEVLGIHTLRGTQQLQFGNVAQPWLREAVKRYARFRLATGKAFASVDIDVRSVRWFSRFLAQQHPQVHAPGQLSRALIEHYLSWFAALGMAGHTTNTLLVCLRGFLETCRRYGWLSGLPATTAIYLDELPRRPQPLPRFVPEFVMAQIDHPAHLARLPDDTTRHLLVLIIETGLRSGDACALPFNPIIDDSVGWPCLKFFNHKMKAEQLVPLSARAAETIRAQQAHLRSPWPDDPPARLFPSPYCNPDGLRSFSYATFRSRLARWEEAIGLHDETGQPVRVTAHQFRHTLGTRLINDGVPQHVVQKLLGHASPQMTARYATIHDATVRAAFDDYQRRRVDIHGTRLDFDPNAPAAEAEWVKHNLARVAASLPNGYCGRPPQQDCPHPNACLTCPDFQTTHSSCRCTGVNATTPSNSSPRPSKPARPAWPTTTGKSPPTSNASSSRSKPSTRSPPMPADNRAALAAATRDRSHKARVQARTAIRRLDRDGVPITFASVAAAADVSRSLLYRDPALRAEIERLRTTTPAQGCRPPTAQRSTDASLKQRLAAALNDNRALRDENAKLRQQIAVLLGAQRTAKIANGPPTRSIGPCS